MATYYFALEYPLQQKACEKYGNSVRGGGSVGDENGNVYFADMSVSVVRSYCIDKMKEGLLPQKWMGKKIAPIKSWGGGDIDYAFQIPQIEYWLKNNR